MTPRTCPVMVDGIRAPLNYWIRAHRCGHPLKTGTHRCAIHQRTAISTARYPVSELVLRRRRYEQALKRQGLDLGRLPAHLMPEARFPFRRRRRRKAAR